MITCFIPFVSQEQVGLTLQELKKCELIKHIYLLVTDTAKIEEFGDCQFLEVDTLNSTATYRAMATHIDTPFAVIYTKYTTLESGQFLWERMIRIAEDTQAGMLYADHYQVMDGCRKPAPVIDYQKGSLRDDFDFGSVLFFNSVLLKEAVAEMDVDYQFAGLYDLRLRLSEKAELVHVNEYLYAEVELDTRKSGEKQFDYVNPRNRAVQIEMEKVCTAYLKRIGGYLLPNFETIAFDSDSTFPVEETVIIPVRNR
ncbi:MAG: glycosyltransferase family 2 protein, partial [Parabacteroides sp.]|nr:glycosyltransferase family 2 protein [Parabacteroides sp.]